MTSQAELVAGRTGGHGKDLDMHRQQSLAELTGALLREMETVRALREALVRQRAGVAADSPNAVHDSCDDIGRILVALENTKRHRNAHQHTQHRPPKSRGVLRPGQAAGIHT